MRRQCEWTGQDAHGTQVRCALPAGHGGEHDVDPAPQDAWDWDQINLEVDAATAGALMAAIEDFLGRIAPEGPTAKLLRPLLREVEGKLTEIPS